MRRYDGTSVASRERFAQLARGHRGRQWQFQHTVRVYLYERIET